MPQLRDMAKMAARRWMLHPDVLPPSQAPDAAKMAAKMAGQRRYQGSDCKRKHGGERYSSTGQCVLCLKMRERNNGSLVIAEKNKL